MMKRARRSTNPTPFPVKLEHLPNYVGQNVNLLAVVVEFSIPHRGRGTDFAVSLKVIDETQHQPEVSVSVFTQSIDLLPHIRGHKDIILLSNVRIKEYEKCPSVVFDKTISTFALFDGKDNNDLTPYQASPTFGPVGAYDTLITQLRNWSQVFPFDAGISDYVVQIKDLRDGYFDIVCKILHASEIEEDVWAIFIWDGTDAPQLSINSKLGDKSNPLPLRIGRVSLPADDLSKFPCLGTVLRVVTDKSYRNLGDHFNNLGSWVRIRNLQIQSCSSGLWMGSLTPNTKIRLLTVDDNSVNEQIRNHEERIEASRQPTSSLTMSSFLTVTDHEDRYATLMDALTSSEKHCFFKCIVRVVSVVPSQPKNLWSTRKNCYCMLMTLEDPTARIDALLCDRDADLFFGGHLALDVLTTNMNKLLGMADGVADDAPRNPPWTEVCLELFFGIGSAPVGCKSFHICDTRVQCQYVKDGTYRCKRFGRADVRPLPQSNYEAPNQCPLQQGC